MAKSVSILMPAYNVTRYISTALDSIFAQSFTDFEVIVVNDGCPDTPNLERSILPYASRIHYIKQENQGVGAARKAAVEASSSPLLAQLDPDDWWEPEYLRIQVRLLETNADADLIYPDGYYFGNPVLEGKRIMDYMPSSGEVTAARLLSADVAVVYSAVMRRDSVLRAGSFDPEIRTAEDFDLWVRMLKSGGKIAYHREPLLHYRLRRESLTAGQAEAQGWLLRVLDKLETSLDLSGDEKRALIRRREATQMEIELNHGKEAILKRDWKSAAWHLELYRRYRPSRKLSLVLMALRSFPWLVGSGMAARDWLLNRRLFKSSRPQQA